MRGLQASRFAFGVALVVAAMVGSGVAAASPRDETEASGGCPAPEVEYTPRSLPEGVNVLRCDLVGELVLRDIPGGFGLGVEIPHPGEATPGTPTRAGTSTTRTGRATSRTIRLRSRFAQQRTTWRVPTTTVAAATT